MLRWYWYFRVGDTFCALEAVAILYNILDLEDAPPSYQVSILLLHVCTEFS